MGVGTLGRLADTDLLPRLNSTRRLESYRNRAQIFLSEASLAQSVSYIDASTSTLPYAMYADETGRRSLDFNMRHLVQLLRIMGAISILKSRRLVIIGASRWFSILLDVCDKVAPRLGIRNGVTFVPTNELKGLVENAEDIPEFCSRDGQGKPYVPTDRRNVWCYERCLSNKNPITQKDIYNSQHWLGPCEEPGSDASTLKAPAVSTLGQQRTADCDGPRSDGPRSDASAQSLAKELSIIAEGSEGDEW